VKFIAGLLIVFYAVLCGAQNPAPITNAAEDEEESERITNAAPGAAQAPAPASVTQAGAASTGAAVTASGDTNLPPAPVKDPAKCVIARLSFDGNLQPDVGGATIPVTFKRLSASYLEGVPVSEKLPRFVEGRSGNAVLVESAFANLLSVGQSCAAEIGAFKPFQGATLSISSDQPWQGKEALAVATKGETGEEGFSIEASVEKAFYTKENVSIVPAYYLASLYLKGQGNVKLTLKDVESGASSEPVYVDLPANWQRFSCAFGYSFKRMNVGANHDADWKTLLPPGTNLAAHLQLVCTTVDSQKLNFFADGLQIEQRNADSDGNVELSPHSWIVGAFQTTQEELAIDVKNDYFNTWKKNGSIAFWFKPLWEARDNSNEIILQIAKGQLFLSHERRKLNFSPAGVSLAPYDWRNNWHHMVVTWNEAGERALYIDGMDYPNAAGAMKPVKNPENIMAGDFIKNLSPNGALDELTLYNITLNSEQAKTLAAVEPAVKPAAASSPATPATELKQAEQPPVPVATVAVDQKTGSNQAPAAVGQDSEEESE